MRIALLIAAALVLAAPASAQPMPPMPTTREDNYELGKRFANCSASFQLMAFVARRAQLPDTVTLAEGRARGWKYAGLMFLAEGMDPSRTDTSEVFDALVEVKLMELRARYETNPDALQAAIPVDFARECEPLVPLQEALIEQMRRGPQ